MSTLRVYTEKQLARKSNSQLHQMLENVKVSKDLTAEEKDLNIAALEFKINGSSCRRNNAILKDIQAGSADISDITGY